MADGSSSEIQTIRSSHYQMMWQHSTLSFRQLHIRLNGKLSSNYLVLSQDIEVQSQCLVWSSDSMHKGSYMHICSAVVSHWITTSNHARALQLEKTLFTLLSLISVVLPPAALAALWSNCHPRRARANLTSCALVRTSRSSSSSARLYFLDCVVVCITYAPRRALLAPPQPCRYVPKSCHNSRHPGLTVAPVAPRTRSLTIILLSPAITLLTPHLHGPVVVPIALVPA
jgi:hypothetical protein